MLQRGSAWRGWLVCAVLTLVLPAVALAAEEHGGGGGLISVDKSLIVQIVNFLILLFILQRLLYKPFLAKMQEPGTGQLRGDVLQGPGRTWMRWLAGSASARHSILSSW